MDLNVAFQAIYHMLAYDVFGSALIFGVFCIGFFVWLGMKTGINPLIFTVVLIAPAVILLANYGFASAWISGFIYAILGIITALGLYMIFTR